MKSLFKTIFFTSLLVTGWTFSVGESSAGKKLSVIEKELDEMMQRIKRLKNQQSQSKKAIIENKDIEVQPALPATSEKIPLSKVPEVQPLVIPESPETEGNTTQVEQVISEFPIVETFSGTVSLYEESNQTFIPVERGFIIEKKSLMRVPAGGELIISFPGKMAALVGENSRVITGPAEEGKFEVYLKNGTVSALLDPERKREDSIPLSIRTRSGVAEAQGTFYAVTEYKGQSYTAVKKGKIEKETKPPTKPDFSAYLSKAKAKANLVSSKK